jgi:hypothetical protein
VFYLSATNEPRELVMDNKSGLYAVLSYLRATTTNGPKVHAQHKVGDHWLGCFIVDAEQEQVMIEIANGDKFVVSFDEVRVPGL